MFKRNCLGFSLLELLVALSLSNLLIISVFQNFLAMKKISSLQENLNQIVFQARQVINLFKEDFANVANIGCLRLANNLRILNHTNLQLDSSNIIQGEPNSITMRTIRDTGAHLLKKINQSTFVFNTAFYFREQQILVFSDCEHVEIAMVESVEYHDRYQIVKLKTPLSFSYPTHWYVGLFNIHRYFIQTTKRIDQQGKLIKALYREDEFFHKKECFENIENLQIQYLKRNGVVSERLDDAIDLAGIKIHFWIKSSHLKQEWITYEFT